MSFVGNIIWQTNGPTAYVGRCPRHANTACNCTEPRRVGEQVVIDWSAVMPTQVRNRHDRRRALAQQRMGKT